MIKYKTSYSFHNWNFQTIQTIKCFRHCPQARATAVADTPESRRLAENTKLQSQVKYHEDFEKQKGKLTQVADDPETLRIRNTSKIISNVAYHGELERKKQMEQKRTLLPEDEIKNGFDGHKLQQMPIHPPTAIIIGMSFSIHYFIFVFKSLTT